MTTLFPSETRAGFNTGSTRPFRFGELFRMPFPPAVSLWMLVTLLLASVAYGWFSALRQVAHGDVFVFYTSGVRFASGESLYAGKASGLTFMYPPFAAAVHQILALFSLKVASGIFSALNLVACFVTLLFSGNWFQLRWGLGKQAVLGGMLLTGFYFFLNLELGQNNIFLLLLTLAALELWLRDRFVLAGILLSGVIFFKLTALFLMGWMVLRGNLRFIYGLVAGFLICLLVPVLFRGWEQSLQDWREFHLYFFRFMLGGHVYTDLRNQNLAATLLRLLCEPLGKYPHATVNLFSLDILWVKAGVKWLGLLLTGVLSVWMVRKRLARQPLHLAEASLFLCLSQLLSGLTWNQHLVMLLPVSVLAVGEFLAHKTLAYRIWLVVLGMGTLSAKFFLGTQIQIYAYSVGLFTWILLVSAIFLMQILRNQYPGRNAQR